MSLTETYKKLKLKSDATGFTGLTEEYEVRSTTEELSQRNLLCTLIIIRDCKRMLHLLFFTVLGPGR